jgi:hypothetical protein
MIARRVPADMIDRSLHADSNDPIDANEPTENADSAEPTEPIDRTEPMEPIESSEFLLPIHRTEPSDLIDHREPLVAMSASLPRRPAGVSADLARARRPVRPVIRRSADSDVGKSRDN